MADLQKLVVRLEAETARYQRELDSARKKLGQFERATQTTSKVLGQFKTAFAAIAGGAIVARLASLTKSTLDYADSVAEASKALGVSVKFYQEVGYAASQAGMKQEKFTASFSKFAQLAEDAANGEKGPGEVFARLGITAEEAGGEVEDLFNLVVRRLDELPDQSARLSVIGDLFGKKVATQWAATLSEGADGLDRMRKSADDLGLVLSERDVENLGALGDAVDTVGQKFKVAFAQGLAEGLTGETGELRDILTDPAFKAGIDGIAAGIRTIGEEIGQLPDLLNQLEQHRDIIQIFAAFAAGAYAFKSKGVVGMAGGGLGGAFLEISRQGLFPSDPSASAAGTSGSLETGMSMMPEPGMSLIPDGYAATVSAATAATTTHTAAVKSHAAAVHEVEEAYDFASEATDDASYAAEQLDAMYRQNEAAILGVDQVSLQYQDTLGQLDALQKAGIISAEQYADAAKRIKDELDGVASVADLWDANTDRMMQAGKSLFASMLTDGKNWKDNLLRFFDQIAASFADMAAEMAMQALFGSGGAGGGGINWGAIAGSLVGSLVGAGGGSIGASNPSAGGGSMILYNADGGMIPPGGTSWVGEEGPELITTSRAARVFSSEDSMAMVGGKTVIQNWTFNTPDADSFRASRRQIQRRENAALRMQ
jgi:hypothetical protein